MSKFKILGIILLVGAVGVIIVSVYNASTYSDFATARNNKGKTVQIIGQLDKSKSVVYDSTLQNLSLKFSMIDDKGISGRVIYFGVMPRDFMRLKEVVVTGHAEDSLFVADDLLLKCPSKYTNDSDSMKTFKSGRE